MPSPRREQRAKLNPFINHEHDERRQVFIPKYSGGMGETRIAAVPRQTARWEGFRKGLSATRADAGGLKRLCSPNPVRPTICRFLIEMNGALCQEDLSPAFIVYVEEGVAHQPHPST